MDIPQIERLKDLALMATPGEWVSTGTLVGIPWEDGSENLNYIADVFRDKDADYIAAVNPLAILELIEDYEAACRMLRDLGAWEEYRDVKDEMLEHLRREFDEMTRR